MKFVPTDELTYWWPIAIKRPNPDISGQWKTERFEMKFRALEAERLRELRDEYAKLETDSERASHEHDVLLEAARDWRGVVDGDKKEVPFSQELLMAMMNAAVWYRLGIYESYNRSLLADGGRRGN